MTRLVGLERDAAGLTEALAVISQVERAGGPEPALLNMTASAKLVRGWRLRPPRKPRRALPDGLSGDRRDREADFPDLAGAEKTASSSTLPLREGRNVRA